MQIKVSFHLSKGSFRKNHHDMASKELTLSDEYQCGAGVRV